MTKGRDGFASPNLRTPLFEPLASGDAEVPEDGNTSKKRRSMQGTVHNPFNPKRHRVSRDILKRRHSAALAAWRAVMA